LGSTAFTGEAFLAAGFFAAFLSGEAVTVARRAADEAATVVLLVGAVGEVETCDGVDPGTVRGVLDDTNNLS